MNPALVALAVVAGLGLVGFAFSWFALTPVQKEPVSGTEEYHITIPGSGLPGDTSGERPHP